MGEESSSLVSASLHLPSISLRSHTTAGLTGDVDKRQYFLTRGVGAQLTAAHKPPRLTPTLGFQRLPRVSRVRGHDDVMARATDNRGSFLDSVPICFGGASTSKKLWMTSGTHVWFSR